MSKTQPTVNNQTNAVYFYATFAVMVTVMLPFEEDWQHHWRLSSETFFSEPWRLISGHFTHLNYMHAFTNCIGLLCIFVVSHKQISLRLWSIATLSLITLIDCSLYLRDDIWFYSGSSSLAIGLCSFGLVVLTTYPRLIKAVCLFCLGLALLFSETPDYLSANGYIGAKAQHWVAFVGGTVLGLLQHVFNPTLKRAKSIKNSNQ